LTGLAFIFISFVLSNLLLDKSINEVSGLITAMIAGSALNSNSHSMLARC
jgi:hypothetical protein